MAGTEKVMMLFSITERGSGVELIEFLNNRNIRFHFQCSGTGTASSEMMDFLGLGSSDKDILISLAPEGELAGLAVELSNNMNLVSRRKGIMMMLAPSAINRLAAAVITRGAGEDPEEGKDRMKSEYKHSLIFVAVNQGYTEQVMQAAKRAGATGGTVIRAHLAGAEQLHGIALQEEKEILTILAPESIRDQILETVNREYGMRSEAQGILCALPVERAFKI